jgi:hypothetical protein
MIYMTFKCIPFPNLCMNPGQTEHDLFSGRDVEFNARLWHSANVFIPTIGHLTK